MKLIMVVGIINEVPFVIIIHVNITVLINLSFSPERIIFAISIQVINTGITMFSFIWQFSTISANLIAIRNIAIMC